MHYFNYYRHNVTTREARLCKQLPAPPSGPGSRPPPGPPPIPPGMPGIPGLSVGPQAFPGPVPGMNARVGAMGPQIEAVRKQLAMAANAAFNTFRSNWNALRLATPAPSPQVLQQALGAINNQLRSQGLPYQVTTNRTGDVSLMPLPTGPSGGPGFAPGLFPGMAGAPALGANPAQVQQQISQMYRSANPESMRPEERLIFQQTIIGSLELQGFIVPGNFDAMIAGAAPLRQATGQMRGFTQIKGAVRFVGVALRGLRLAASPREREVLRKAIADRLQQYDNNPRRLVDLTLSQVGDTVTELKMKPRNDTELNPTGTSATDRLVPVDITAFKAALVAQTLREGPDFTVVSGEVVFTNPSEENMEKVLRALQALSPERVPTTPTGRIDAYAANTNRKVNVGRTPPTGDSLTKLELDPRTDIDAAQRVDTAAVQRALTDKGVPAAAIAIVSGKVEVTGDGLNATNLPKVAEALEGLVIAPAPAPGTEHATGVETVRSIRESELNGLVLLDTIHDATLGGGGVRTVEKFGQSIEFKFEDGKWEFKKGTTWKEIDGTNTVENADVGGVANAANSFNTNILSILQRLNSGEAAAFTEVEQTEKAFYDGRDYLAQRHGASLIPASGNYQVNKEGKNLEFTFEDGKWKFKTNSGTWSEINATSTVANADVGNDADAADKFNDDVLPMLSRLNGREAAAFTEMENADTANRSGSMYLNTQHNATSTAEGPKVRKRGKDLQFRFNQETGKWTFKRPGTPPTWIEIDGANQVVGADLGGGAGVGDAVNDFNNDVLPTLKRLNDREAVVFTEMDNLRESRERGVYFLDGVHDGSFDAGGYKVTKDGKELKFKFESGKWQFEADGGTWKEIDGTNQVVGADLGGGADVADALTAFNDRVLPVLENLNGRNTTTITQIENTERSVDGGLLYINQVHNAAPDGDAHKITKEGKDLKLRVHEGKWQFQASGPTWKEINASNTVVAADLGGGDVNDAVIAFNTTVLPTLRDLNGADSAAFDVITRLDESIERGRYYLREVHSAAVAGAEYTVNRLGENLKFKFDQGKWKFERAGTPPSWVEINATNAVANADVRDTGPAAQAFNRDVLPVLRQLNS